MLGAIPVIGVVFKGMGSVVVWVLSQPPAVLDGVKAGTQWLLGSF